MRNFSGSKNIAIKQKAKYRFGTASTRPQKYEVFRLLGYNAM
jgi:hypothetical protein